MMVGMGSTPAFDLRTEEWVPVVIDGKVETVSLVRLLRDAHQIESIDPSDEVVRAGLMRFLPDIAALVARSKGDDESYRAWGREGFPETAISAALERLEPYMWLIHPVSPFMQSNDIMFEPDKVPFASSLNVVEPSASMLAWWGGAVGSSAPRPLSYQEAARLLPASWYFGKTKSGAPSSVPQYYEGDPDGRPRGSLRHLGSIGTVFVFWEGTNLAETLLANVDPRWVEEDSLPAWCAAHEPYDLAAITPGSLYACSVSGVVHRLIPGDGAQFSHVRTAGRVTTTAQRNARQAAETAHKGAKAALEAAKEAAADDPSPENLERLAMAEKDEKAASATLRDAKKDAIASFAIGDPHVLTVERKGKPLSFFAAAGIPVSATGLEFAANLVHGGARERAEGLLAVANSSTLIVEVGDNSSRLTKFFWLNVPGASLSPQLRRYRRKVAAVAAQSAVTIGQSRSSLHQAALMATQEEGSAPVASHLAGRLKDSYLERMEHLFAGQVARLAELADADVSEEETDRMYEAFSKESRKALFQAYDSVMRSSGLSPERVAKARANLLRFSVREASA